MKNFYLVLLLLLFSFIIYADVEFRGFADSYHSVKTNKSLDYMTSKTRFRGELSFDLDDSFLFTSFNMEYNPLLKKQTNIGIREVFFEYTGDYFELKLGRQFITWGNSDSVRIIDIISPFDLSEFLARDYDDSKIPVTAIKLKYLYKMINLDLIFIPIADFNILSLDSNSPWYFLKSFPKNSKYQDEKPKRNLKNSEYGLKLAFYMHGIDFAFSYVNAFNKMPSFKSKIVNTDMLVIPVYNKMHIIGTEFSIPFKKIVFRGEFAFYKNETRQKKVPKKLETETKDAFNNLVGLDIFLENSLTISMQYSQKFILNANKVTNSEDNPLLLTLSISKKMFREKLLFSTFGYYDITNTGFFIRSYFEYNFTDSIHLLLGYNFVHAEKGAFALYDKNSEIWAKAKIYF